MNDLSYLEENNSCFIAAHAGTGKTKIVIDRVLALLLAGNEPHSILAVTFTNNAADEMKQRIVDLIIKLSKYHDAELEKFLLGFFHKDKLDNAVLLKYKEIISAITEKIYELNIQTVHSFCTNLLQEFTIEAGLQPNFKVMDDNISKILLDDAYDALFDGGDAIKTLMSGLMSHHRHKTLTDIFDNIIKNRSKIFYILSAYENFSAYKKQLYNFLNISELYDYETEIFKNFFAKIDKGFLQDVYRSVKQYGSKGELSRINDLQKLNVALEHNNGYTEYLLFQGFFCKKTTTEFRKSPVTKNAASYIAKYQEKIITLKELYQNTEDLYYKYKLATQSVEIMAVAQIFIENYDKVKKNRNLIDYEDLILKSLELLKSKDYKDIILYKLNNNLSHILIDEAQDISPWQWEVVQLLLEDFFASDIDLKIKSFFIVGDEKQSIYSFQGADYRLFADVKQLFAQKLSHKGQKLHEINLETSYRSATEILKFVDQTANNAQVISALTTQNKPITHKVFRKDVTGKVEFHNVIEEETLEQEEISWKYPIKITEKKSNYDHVAAQISQLVQDMLTDNKLIAATNQKIKPADILILCRNRNKFYDSIIRNIQKKHIKVESDQKILILNYVLIMDFVSIVKFIVFPHDSLNLAALLKSPIFSLSETNLFKLCVERDAEVSLWQEINKNDAYQDILTTLNDIIDFSHLFPIDEFFLYVIEKYQLRSKYEILYGSQAAELINLFLEISADFIDKISDKIISNSQLIDNNLQKTKLEDDIITYDNPNYLSFLEYILRCNIMVKNQITNEAGSVKVMSVHGSKGLQAPIVILTVDNSNSNKKDVFNFDYNKKLIFFNNSAKPKTLDDYFQESKDLKSQEELRLLYVALTRAQDELHIFSVKNNKKNNLWFDLLSEAV